jgi:hypothetical protein
LHANIPENLTSVYYRYCVDKKIQEIHFHLVGKIIKTYTDKKENQIFLIYKEIKNGAVAKSYMRKGFLIFEEMRKYLIIYED